MKIVQVYPTRSWGGGDKQIYYLCRELKQLGHDVTLITTHNSELAKRTSCYNIRVLEWFPRFLGLDVLRLGRIIRHFQKERYDIVNIHRSSGHFVCGLAARLSGRTRVVVTKRYGGFLYSTWCDRNLTDHFITVSSALHGKLIRSGILKEKVSTIKDGIDPSELLLQSLPKAKVRDRVYQIGVISRLSKKKGIDFLIRAIPFVLARFPKSCFLIVGTGKEELALKKLVDRMGLISSVYFLGFREDIPQVLSQLDLFIYPSLTGGGQGTALLEAQLMGVPVVAARIGGLLEVITHEETGLLVSPKDPQEFASAIIRLQEDREFATQLAEKGKERVLKEYKINIMVNETLKVYESLIK